MRAENSQKMSVQNRRIASNANVNGKSIWTSLYIDLISHDLKQTNELKTATTKAV